MSVNVFETKGIVQLKIQLILASDVLHSLQGVLTCRIGYADGGSWRCRRRDYGAESSSKYGNDRDTGQCGHGRGGTGIHLAMV